MPVAKETSAPRNPIPQGVHQAICFGVVDLGTQQPLPSSKFNRGPRRRVLLMFEIPEERIQVERDGRMVDLPRALSKEFGLSLHEKAALRKFLESWRGRQFTQDEKAGFEVGNVAGVNCMLNVIHKDNGYEDIAGCMPLAKGMQKRTPENPVTVYDIDQPIPATLPEWVRKKIMLSDEHMQAAQNGGHYDEPPPSHFDDEDPLPF